MPLKEFFQIIWISFIDKTPKVFWNFHSKLGCMTKLSNCPLEPKKISMTIYWAGVCILVAIIKKFRRHTKIFTELYRMLKSWRVSRQRTIHYSASERRGHESFQEWLWSDGLFLLVLIFRTHFSAIRTFSFILVARASAWKSGKMIVSRSWRSAL